VCLLVFSLYNADVAFALHSDLMTGAMEGANELKFAFKTPASGLLIQFQRRLRHAVSEPEATAIPLSCIRLPAPMLRFRLEN
jgi:hypothetical protein